MSRQRTVCPIFRDNTEHLFPRLLNDPTHGSFVRNAIAASTLHQGDRIPKIPSTAARHPRSQVHIVNLDSLECARLIIARHGDKRPLVHNMASDIKPGGGVIHGALAQEESLCRRSLLYMSLEHYYRSTFVTKQKSASGQVKKVINWYSGGGMGEEELSYNPDVLVIRDSNNEPLKESDWYTVSFVSSAAIRRPATDASGKYMSDKRDALLMIDKYKALLRLAWHQGHRNLVLSAWGSGCYKIPCQHMAEILMDLLFVDKEFVGVFDHVFISIIDPYLQTQNYLVYKAAVETATNSFDETRSSNGNAMPTSSSSSHASAAAAGSPPVVDMRVVDTISSSSDLTMDVTVSSSTSAENITSTTIQLSKSQRRRMRKKMTRDHHKI